MRTEVYSWRIESGLKEEIESVARGRRLSAAKVIELAVREWLSRNQDEDDEVEQRRIRAAASRWIGSIHGDDPDRAKNASGLVRTALRRRHERKRAG
jgi:Arc/MetJ-type ribon-helix-helix transcriptional regulator